MIAIVLLLISPESATVLRCDRLEINTWGTDESASTQAIGWVLIYDQLSRRNRYQAAWWHVSKSYNESAPVCVNGRWLWRVDVRGNPVVISARCWHRTRTRHDPEVHDRRYWHRTPPSIPTTVSAIRNSLIAGHP